jgi:hypothetical protein
MSHSRSVSGVVLAPILMADDPEAAVARIIELTKTRNLLYTGITRGKRLVVLVGQQKAVAIAVRNVSGRRRWSKLAEWLRPGPPVSRRIGMAK